MGLQSAVLYNRNGRRWVYFGRDDDRNNNLIDTNEYLIVNNGRGMLLDPGGLEIFPSVVTGVTREIALDAVDVIVASHQDPDIISSLSMWLAVCPEVKVYASWVWGGFIPHFGNARPVETIPDAGMPLALGGDKGFQLVPAHYLHSSGNFNLYDPDAKILFSADIGAALLPPDKAPIFVEDFDAHVQYMEAFHKRWMPSNQAKAPWLTTVRALDIDYMCPQHGAIFRKKEVQRFLDWFEALEVGVTG